MTIAQALSDATRRLESAGVCDAAGDAEVLLRHVTGMGRADLYARPLADLEDDLLGRFQALVDERALRRPIQYLTGVRDFWRHEFKVTPDVLIPRPETEVLVEAALELLKEEPRAVVVDVGTGSGCIALSLAAEAPDSEVHATDLSPAALGVARENARRLGLQDRVAFHEGDLLRPLQPLFGRIDMVVSNPPYVDRAEADTLAPEVRDHEPPLALFAPLEPLGIYKRLFPEAALCLRPGGRILVEIGLGQSQGVAAILADAGLALEQVLPDLARIPRVVVAKRPTVREP